MPKDYFQRNQKYLELLYFSFQIYLQFILYNLCNIQLINMSFFGVELNSQVNRLILEIRLKLAQNKLSPNFRTIYRSFAKYDPETSGLISTNLFEKALNENGLFFKKFQIQAFQKAFLNQNGAINWFAFLQNLREPMGPFRRQVIQQIFDEISGGNSEATIAQLKQKFNPEGNDNFKKVVKDQKANFEGLLGLVVLKDGKLSKNQFIAYYDDISINYPQDDSFSRFVCNQWGVQFKKAQKYTEQQIKQAIKAFRFKLIQKTNGTNDEFLLKKIFSQFDPNKNQLIGAYELDLTLKKLELPLAPKLIQPLLEQLDKNKSGYIEYDQFKKFIFFDPFHK